MYQRIVCLTEEPTEILYRLGEERRIVGISEIAGALTDGVDALHRIIGEWARGSQTKRGARNFV